MQNLPISQWDNKNNDIQINSDRDKANQAVMMKFQLMKNSTNNSVSDNSDNDIFG
jgi:hypothetical protein